MKEKSNFNIIILTLQRETSMQTNKLTFHWLQRITKAGNGIFLFSLSVLVCFNLVDDLFWCLAKLVCMQIFVVFFFFLIYKQVQSSESLVCCYTLLHCFLFIYIFFRWHLKWCTTSKQAILAVFLHLWIILHASTLWLRSSECQQTLFIIAIVYAFC